MALTRSFRELVRRQVASDPAYGEALLREGIDTMLAGEVDTGKAILRDYIKATIGFEKLGEATATPPKRLIRMFGPRGNPQARNLFSVLGYLQRQAGLEWLIWQRILELDPGVRDYVMFGDYGADNADLDFGTGGRAITHLRYATGIDWLIVRGDDDRGTIRSVARRIVDSGNFSGETFSAGDEFISSRADGLAGIGNPMIWRWVNMNHHMTLVTSDLGALYKVAIPVPVARRQPVQEELFVRT